MLSFFKYIFCYTILKNQNFLSLEINFILNYIGIIIFIKLLILILVGIFFFYFISKIVSTIVLIHTDLDEMN